jgi:uncharacterized membrane protein YqjE
MANSEDDVAHVASRLWAGVLEAVHLRVELFGLELGEELRRLGQLAISALTVVFALFMLLLTVNVLLLAAFWDTHRVAVAAASCLFYALLAVAAALFHRRRSRRQAPPFAAIATVLSDDERALRELL